MKKPANASDIRQPAHLEQFTSRSPDETFEHAASLPGSLPCNLILLKGELGAGKTLWARGFAKGLEITEPVNSPSYAIMNVYTKDSDPSVPAMYHLDLYRIDCFEELADLDLFEIIESGTHCLVEWPEKAARLFSFEHVLIRIAAGDDENSRKVSMEHFKP